MKSEQAPYGSEGCEVKDEDLEEDLELLNAFSDAARTQAAASSSRLVDAQVLPPSCRSCARFLGDGGKRD